MSTDTFSEAPYYGGFLQIRNYFRKFNGHNLVYNLIAYASGGVSREDRLHRYPWLALLLVKWILLDPDFPFIGRRSAEQVHYERLLNLTQNLSDLARLPNQFDNLHLCIRAIAYQQFVYQLDLGASDYLRQFALFADLDPGHRLRTGFRQSAGLEIREFLQLGLALIALHRQRGSDISEASFAPLVPAVSPAGVNAFLDVLSDDAAGYRSRFRRNDDGRRRASEYFEQSPFRKRPLLKAGSQYRVVHPAFLHRALEHFVYSHLRDLDPQEFMQSFGRIFEAYVGDVARYSGLDVVTEDGLKALGKKDGNLVDFVLADGAAHVLVDAKGVAPTQRVMSSHLSEVLLGATKSSALKAIGQAINVLRWIRQGGANGAMSPKPENFLIVVTYDELYLGNGQGFRDSVAAAEVDRLYSDQEDAEDLPLRNVYFMPVFAFEALCQTARTGKLGLADALRQFRAADASPTTMKFDVRLHLAALGIPVGQFQPLSDRLALELKDLAAKTGS